MNTDQHISQSINTEQQLREAVALIFIVGTLLTGMLFAMGLTVVEGVFAATTDGLTGNDFGALMAYIIPLLLVSLLIDAIVSGAIYLRVRASILQQ